MAVVSFISSPKLISLISSADPHRNLLVEILNNTQLSLRTTGFQRVAIIDLAEEKVISVNSGVETPVSLPTSVSVPKASRKSGKYQLMAFGETVDTYSLKDLLSAGLLALEKTKPGTLEKLSMVKKSTKRIVAQNPAELFDTPGLSEAYGLLLRMPLMNSL